jgi:DNA replication protein DnaC
LTTLQKSLRRLTNQEYDRVARLAQQAGNGLSTCPTCHASLIRVTDDVEGWENGTYRFRGEEHPCDCDTQRALYRHYLAAGIPEQYMRLNWSDYRGDPEVIDPVAQYLDKWQAFKDNGMGMEFASENLGVGKTFAATHVGKELVKRGVPVLFTTFLDVINVYTRDNAQELGDRLRDTTVIILDEVVPPYGNQINFFSSEFERLIRHRTNHNMPTIMTTNMEPQELHDTFPRVYSLLEAKQWRVILRGEDARRRIIADENLEIALNEEIRPIT